MQKVDKLYDYAKINKIKIYKRLMLQLKSFSFPDKTIAIDNREMTTAEETVCLAHEIGHIKTSSFYNISCPLDIRQKHENHADRWAIRKIVPLPQLLQLIIAGEHVWDIAEHFGVTDEFIIRSILYYKLKGELNQQISK